jgi:putative tricarboxylic transport membrane protein
VRMANLLSGIVLLVFGVALLFWVIPWQVEESFGGEVSPRLLPQICAIGIAVLSIVLIASNATRPSQDDSKDADAPISWVESRAMFVIAGLLGAGIWLFTLVGPVVASAVLIVGILFAMGERRVIPFVAIPSVLIGGSYILFYKILGTAIL